MNECPECGCKSLEILTSAWDKEKRRFKVGMKCMECGHIFIEYVKA